jgi:hypothetical protein
VPTEGVPLVQTPPVGELVNASVPPTQTVRGPGIGEVPIIADGCGFTVIVVVAKQPFARVYVITAVPAAMPVTTPEEEPTVAIPGEAEVHTPPDGVPVSSMVEPAQTLVGPVITGLAFTVTVVTAKQPVDNV